MLTACTRVSDNREQRVTASATRVEVEVVSDWKAMNPVLFPITQNANT